MDNKYKSRLKTKYEDEIAGKLVSEFSIENKMAIPKVSKVIVNSGIGDMSKNKELIKTATRDFAIITGQKPSIRRAKLSVASFSLRQGQPVGLKTTLRKDRMYDFLDRLFSVTLPRLRDFRGLSANSFDKNANYTFGIEEHTVFPEIEFSNTTKPFGLEVTIVTNTKSKEEALKLLELMGMPFEKEE
jgi:large subunit ribosomal protein L5